MIFKQTAATVSMFSRRRASTIFSSNSASPVLFIPTGENLHTFFPSQGSRLEIVVFKGGNGTGEL